MTEARTPLVSMIVVCYNQASFVLETLESVKAQTYTNTELIIIDDCSTDDSVAVIERWLQQTGTAATFIRHDKNMGVCRTLNDALAAAKGKYISMIASDDLWLPDKIERQVEIMESQPEHVGAVYSDTFQIDDGGRTLPGLHMASHWKMAEMPHGRVLDTLMRGNFVPGMATLVRRSCYDTIGVYDENLPWEDWDMWMRMARRYDFIYSPAPSAKYRVHGKSYSHSDRSRMCRDLLVVALKQWRLGDLTQDQKAVLTTTMLGFAEELCRLGDRRASDFLWAIWEETGESRGLWRYWCVKLGIYWVLNGTRLVIRNNIWFPLLHVTRPVRHSLGLREGGSSVPVKRG